ncbi:hypothetical protein [Thermospira aquatica]|uniref:Uncharacterized protein n=1 Tax=Thermospira aquatica TaxID=2828656 RepID=A0AAX3BC54_9SPIR|nr:hypothetical protein [Thermospira aquatica]URA09731.1 hypothetical protein KDW03_09615 [Thermospira aquatica]
MRVLVFLFLTSSLFASSWTLKPYFISTHNEVWLQDLLVEKLPTNMLVTDGKSSYTAKEIGMLLRKVGMRDFILVGEEVNVYRGVRLITPEIWFDEAQKRYEGWIVSEIELPEYFEVREETIADEGIILLCRVYLADRVEERRYTIPARKKNISSGNVGVKLSYRFEREGEKEGFLVYEKGGLRIRVPVRILPTQLDEILVENKSNQRVLRFKRGEIEGL